MFECNRYQDGIDTHNKFDIKLTAKASFIKNQNIRQDVYFSNFFRRTFFKIKYKSK